MENQIVCESFLEDDHRYTHKHKGLDKVYQCMFWNNVGNGERCAVIVTEDELAHLITESIVINSLTFIGTSSEAWNDDHFRERVCDKALEIIKQNET